MSGKAAGIALSLLVSGCGMSSTAMLASAVVEGTSVAATGKGVADYALSAVTDRDCVLLYGLTRGRVCTETEPQDVEEEAASPVEAASGGLPGAVMPRAAPPVPRTTAKYEEAWTLVLGTVEDYGQAVSLARRLRPKPGLITALEVQGKVVYRVTTEPFSLAEASDRRQQVAAQSFANAELAAVCPRWMQDGKCVVLDRVLPL